MKTYSLVNALILRSSETAGLRFVVTTPLGLKFPKPPDEQMDVSIFGFGSRVFLTIFEEYQHKGAIK